MPAHHVDRTTPDLAVRRALEWIQEGRRVDIAPLAADLGVGRTTMHRWFGTRERLVGDALWALLDRGFDQFEAEADGRGVGRLTFIVGRSINSLVASRPIARFFEADAKALTVAMSPESRLIARFAERLERRIAVEQRLGALSDQLERAEVARALAHVATSLALVGVSSGVTPDQATITRVVASLLRHP